MTATCERLLHDGRPMLRNGDEPGWADYAYDSIRALNHITSSYGRHPIPAPVAYRLLGDLSGMAGMLPQLCQQLGGGLGASLETFDVYDNNREPAQSVAQAIDALTQAANLAKRLTAALDEAQSAINAQGYNDGSGANEQ
ncbi:hypothetical protein [Nocardioides pacificus]